MTKVTRFAFALRLALVEDAEPDAVGRVGAPADPMLEGDGGSLDPARMSVSTTPGATALTVMPCSATSRARPLVKPITPAFAAAYAVLEKTPPPCCAVTEDMLTTRPYAPSIIAGTNALLVR